MSDITELQAIALEISQRYAELNQKKGQAAWGPKERAMGFAVDVGELLEIVMAKENLRSLGAADAKLGHELADCLWSVLVLAAHYGVDLETEFHSNMEGLKKRISEAAA